MIRIATLILLATIFLDVINSDTPLRTTGPYVLGAAFGVLLCNVLFDIMLPSTRPSGTPADVDGTSDD